MKPYQLKMIFANQIHHYNFLSVVSIFTDLCESNLLYISLTDYMPELIAISDGNSIKMIYQDAQEIAASSKCK